MMFMRSVNGKKRMLFQDQLTNLICNPEAKMDGVNTQLDPKDIELHRNILLKKRLKTAFKLLPHTAKTFGARFSSLHTTYAVQEWPKPSGYLFDDVLDFVEWLKGLNRSEIRECIDITEVNWVKFQNMRGKFSIHIVPLKEAGKIKNWAIQLLFRSKGGVRERYFFLEIFKCRYNPKRTLGNLSES